MGLRHHHDRLRGDHVDILIVGAGPTGLMAALWMAELGVKARIIDKRYMRTMRGRADCIHVRSMEIWESFDMVDAVSKYGSEIGEWRLWTSGDDGDLHRKQRKCALGTDLSRFLVGTMHQGHIEATLIDAIRKRSGAEVERGTIPLSIAVDEQQINDALAYPVRVDIRRLQKADGTGHDIRAETASPISSQNHRNIEDQSDADRGSVETIFAKYVIGADGAQSWVRGHLGIRMCGTDRDTSWGVMDVRPISNFPDIRRNCTIQSNNGTLLLVPREKGLVRICVVLGENISDDDALEEMLTITKRIMSPFEFDYSFCDWWAAYRVGQKVSESYSWKHRVFLAGDAAHTMTPKGGKGLNVSMQDAYNLGWKLGMVVRGHLDQRILSTYETERRPIAEGLNEIDSTLFRILNNKGAHTTSDDTYKIYQRLRDYGSGVNICYEPNVINVHPLGPSPTNLQVGRRFPSFQVYSQATSLQVELQQLLRSDGCWRLMVFAGIVSKRLQLERVNVLGEQLARFTHKYPSTKKGQDFLDVLLIHASRESEVEITDFHNSFFRYDAEKGWDYDRVFTRVMDRPHGELQYTHSKQNLSFGTECMVVIRPDQHVGWIGRLDEFDLLEDYFYGFMAQHDGSVRHIVV